MSFVIRQSYTEPSERISPEEMKEKMAKKKWQTVDWKITEGDLENYFKFLNDAVVIRNSPEGMPLMTTTAIYGPIRPHTKVALTPGEGSGVQVLEEGCTGSSLLDHLEYLQTNAPEPKDANAIKVRARWTSAEDGGAVPALDAASNVFGDTGSLYVNEKAVTFPVMDTDHPDYHKTLAYYGGKLLAPREEFYLGFGQVLFGMEYNTSLPDYIRSYALSPSGGGGMFVEHHPFPHIFMPRPTADGYVYCEAKVTLGRKIWNDAGSEEEKKERRKNPQIRFTTFRIPADGSAIAIRPDTIHNDSFTNGRLAVFVANTPADTVAFRQTSPFTDISVKDNEKNLRRTELRHRPRKK